ncbi:MAG: hypothetical protein NVS4B7_09610 [Ktedonobacteraceae bacterium]
MAEYKVNEAAWNIARSVRETTQAVTESSVAAHERNMAFARSTFENGIEVLKSHAEGTRSLLREQSEQGQRQQGNVQPVMNSAIAAQERNMHFAQTTFENGTELWKNHVHSTRTLLQTVAEQSQKQQEAFRDLARESVDAYVDFIFAPFSYYKQAIDTAESIAMQGVETAQKVGRQSWETAHNVTRQGFEAAQQAVQQGQQAARQGFEAAEQAAYQGQQSTESNYQNNQ